MFTMLGITKSTIRHFRHMNPTAVLAISRQKSEECPPHTLPDLPYPYDCLDPIICEEIMMVHHQKHHQTYVDNLNKIEKQMKAASAKNDTCTMIALAPALRFNGGGHINHCLFWESLSPKCSEGSKELMQALIDTFGSYDCFKDDLAKLAIGVQGSGWAWLGYDPTMGKLRLAQCANQDPLEATTGMKPLLGIDVWEHAYYMQYKNCRAEYVKALYDIVNWEVVSKRYTKAIC